MMKMSGKIEAHAVFKKDDLLKYFQHSDADVVKAEPRLKPLLDSIKIVHDYGQSWDELRNNTITLDSEVRTKLQYYKDERLLTLYAFAALDLLKKPEHLPKRIELLNKLMHSALGDKWQGDFTQPTVMLERQFSSPCIYSKYLKTEVDRHPNAYVRAIGEQKTHLEGPTHVDAVIMDGPENKESVHFFEAKFLSDISHDITFAWARNQIARNIDVGLNEVKDVGRFYFVLITPRMFKHNYWDRFYGYKMREYMSDPKSIERDLPHLKGSVDFVSVSKHIGWTTWEDICEIIQTSESGLLPLDELKQFFTERCLWSGK
jgi:hypothetical protein